MISEKLLFQAICNEVSVTDNKLADMLLRNSIPVRNTESINKVLVMRDMTISSHDYTSYVVYELLQNGYVIDSIKLIRGRDY